MTSKWLQKLIDIKILSSLREGKFEINLIKVVNNTDNRKLNVSLIDWSKLTEKQKRELKSSIRQAFDENDVEVLEAEYVEEVKDYKNKEKSNTKGQRLVSFFVDKIPQEDLYALKTSVYIKQVFDEGKEIKALRDDLRYKYGQRGNNISNLYSAGYFESWIKPMYESMAKKDNFNEQTFLDAYELIVEEYPFAVFVHTEMSSMEIKNEIKRKIGESQSYGIKAINVHGIGSGNIYKILEVVRDLQSELDFELDTEIKGSVLVARLKLNSPS